MVQTSPCIDKIVPQHPPHIYVHCPPPPRAKASLSRPTVSVPIVGVLPRAGPLRCSDGAAEASISYSYSRTACCCNHTRSGKPPDSSFLPRAFLKVNKGCFSNLNSTPALPWDRSSRHRAQGPIYPGDDECCRSATGGGRQRRASHARGGRVG